MNLFTLKAGYRALQVIKEEGLKASQVRIIAGAAGGPKWIVLGGLDRYLFGQFFKGRKDPLYLVGASIATWRYAAIAQKDPLEALENFRRAYFEQTYSASPGPAEVTREARRVMETYLSDDAIEYILNHPWMRLSVLAAKSRGLLASGSKKFLMPGLAAAAAMNFFSRRSLGCFFSRAFFYDARDIPPFYAMSEFPIERIPLSKENFREAVLASGSIPLAMEGIRNVPGAYPGTYRDGGMVDYQMDIPFNSNNNEVVLFPHYTNRVIPGWFDKHVPWRRPDRENMAGVLMISPSDKFIEKLHGEKIPDRNDFKLFSGRDSERIAVWDRAFALSIEMAEEFKTAVETGSIADALEPL